MLADAQTHRPYMRDRARDRAFFFFSLLHLHLLAAHEGTKWNGKKKSITHNYMHVRFYISNTSSNIRRAGRGCTVSINRIRRK